MEQTLECEIIEPEESRREWREKHDSSCVRTAGGMCGTLGVIAVIGIIMIILVGALAIAEANNGGLFYTDTTPYSPIIFNTTQYRNSSVWVDVADTNCTFEYNCPPGCSMAVNAEIGCCRGCYLGQQGECGLNVRVGYDQMPKSSFKDQQKIYLLASNDGEYFWQTGFPVPIRNPTNSILGATSSETVKDGCYGPPTSIVIVACLSTYNITGKTFNSFPIDYCMDYWGQCLHLNDVWTDDVPGCTGPVWLYNYAPSSDLESMALNDSSTLRPSFMFLLLSLSLSIALICIIPFS